MSRAAIGRTSGPGGTVSCRLMRPGRTAATVLSLALGAMPAAGCSRSMTVRVDRIEENGRLVGPLAHAHVYSITLDQSDVPLPVTLENLERAFAAQPCPAVTDAAGRARLEVYPKGRCLVQVSPPPFGELADRTPWLWKVDPATGRAERWRLSDADDSPDVVRISVER